MAETRAPRGEMVSAVVVTYNSAACVGVCLRSVRDAFPDAELIVVDNGSCDSTVAAVRSAAPDARLIEIRENIGFGRACNVGAQAASASHLLFLNPDAAVAEVQCEELERVLRTRPFGLVAPALDSDRDRIRGEASWVRDYLRHTFGTLRPREWSSRARPYQRESAAWVSGAMLLVSRDEFLELGGFDRRFFLYYEDRDLSRRYLNANLPVRATEAIVGRHTSGTSSASEGLGASRIAWTFLGWIQYVWLHEGERDARRAAHLGVTTLHVLRLAVHGLAFARWARARRKARELDDVLERLADFASEGVGDFVPDAQRVIRTPLFGRTADSPR